MTSPRCEDWGHNHSDPGVCVCGGGGWQSPGLCLVACACTGRTAPQRAQLLSRTAQRPECLSTTGLCQTTAKVQSPTSSRKAQGCRAGTSPGHAAHSSGLKPGVLGRKPRPCLQLPGDAAPLRTKLSPDALLQLFKLRRVTRTVEGRAALKPRGRRSLVGHCPWRRISHQALLGVANYFFPFRR